MDSAFIFAKYVDCVFNLEGVSKSNLLKRGNLYLVTLPCLKETKLLFSD